MLVILQFIPGIMVGIEWCYDNDLLVVDLLIVRVMFFYNVKEKLGD